MRRFYIGAEITHNETNPRAVLVKSSRMGKVKRWVDAGVSHLDSGMIRERIALLMPFGFRFAKDQVSYYSRATDHSLSDAKFRCALAHAEGKYVPHAKLQRKKTQTEEVPAEG